MLGDTSEGEPFGQCDLSRFALGQRHGPVHQVSHKLLTAAELSVFSQVLESIRHRTHEVRPAAHPNARIGDAHAEQPSDDEHGVAKLERPLALAAGARVAVALLDEVHRTASPAVVREEEIDWTPVHDRDYLAAAKRIGLSARPGAHPPTGPVAYRLTYEAAVRAGALPGYRVVVAVAPTGSRADALLEPIQSTLTASRELVLAPPAARDGVLSLIGHPRRSFSGPTTQLVLAALASPRAPREALAHAVRTEPWLRASFEALASVDDRFARALQRARGTPGPHRAAHRAWHRGMRDGDAVDVVHDQAQSRAP